ncbi:MAG TPA: hypothetical protein VFV50_07865 [Bdellovibrionales bacterium]|nr:hypothetical protein [Bdellovibrionales bacterium]
MKTLTAAILILALSSQALALTRTETFKVGSPQSRLREAAEQGLGISRGERQAKKEIHQMRAHNPEKYNNLNIAPNNHVAEMQMGLGKIEPAKTLAKFYLMKLAQNNWSRLRQLAFLDTPVDDWSEARHEIKRELEKITYVPTQSSSHFRFEVPWGSALVRADLKEVHATITVADHLDGNRLTEGAENIKIPDEQ